MALGRMTMGRVLAVYLLGTAVGACTSSSPGDVGLEQLTPDERSEPPPNIETGDKADVTQPPVTDTGSATGEVHSGGDVSVPSDVAVPGDTAGPMDDGAGDVQAPDGSGSDGGSEDTGSVDAEEEDAAAPVDDVSPSDEDVPPAEDTQSEPECMPGSAICVGQDVTVCGPTGDSWTVVATCSEDKPCVDGTCCSPQCEGKSCGDDGCGGLCGTCEGGWPCGEDGACQTAPECDGDGSCDDGNPCTEGDTCTDGLCLGEPVDCGDDDPCTQTGCDEMGCYAKPADCDDEDPCTDDGCNSLGCFHKPITCDDGLPCTDDSCGATGCEVTIQAGTCLIDDACVESGTIADDNVCLICDPGESNTGWSARGPVACDDGNACTTGDVCDGDTCVGGAGLTCISDNPCEATTCDPNEGCVTAAVLDGEACSAPCFEKATCEAGSCEPVPDSAVVCPASDAPCVASLGCDLATGACTVETYVAEGAGCESDQDVCTLETCDGSGACTSTGETESCDDQAAINPCWDFSCQPTSGCVVTTFNDGVACDDGNACTIDDTCIVLQFETCQGSPIPIDDDNPCTDDFCQNGVVNHEPIDGMACDPESPCTNAGICEGGVCEAMTACECTEDSECPETEICVDFACTGTYCGNGICDPGDDTACPDDCASCTQAIWCNGACGDPVFGKPLCAKDCCGDGFCANTETAECCPEDCTPETVCGDAQVVDSVPAEITGDNSDSNALFATLASACGDTVFPGLDLFDFGEGREDVIQFIAPFSGTFGFQLSASWSSQLWFFTDCADAGSTCIESADMAVGQTSTLAGLELSAGETIYVVVDSGSLYFGDGPYTLLIDGICSPECGGKECGDDGCGETCGVCEGGEICADGVCEPSPETCSDALFISQYVEGDSAHKALELYNHTGALVDLSTYVLWRLSGGGNWDDDKDVQSLSGVLAPGDVFVICKSGAHGSFSPMCDQMVGNGFLNYSGDDAIALVRDGVIVDQVGEEGADPSGGGWEVAGVNTATKDHTLVRGAWVTNGSTDWSDSAANEWIVLSKNDTTGIGTHDIDSACTCTPSCDGVECGGDGCGGSCGECVGGQFCTEGGDCISEDELCDYQLDCPTNQICGWWPTDELNRCSSICKGPNDCATGEVCDRVPGSAHIAYCRSAGDGGAAGEACTWDEACASGICVDGLCRETCVSQAGCPVGQVCEALDWWFGSMSACTPTAGTQSGDVCGACASNHCDFLALPGPPKCADLCATTSDCEVNQTCNLVDHTGEDNWDTVPYHPTYDDDLTDAIMGCYTSTGGLGDHEDGDPCDFSQDCVSGTCLPIVDFDSSGYCTRPCVQSTDCSGGMVCRLTVMNLASKYLYEDGNAALGNNTMLRLCDFATGAPGN